MSQWAQRLLTGAGQAPKAPGLLSTPTPRLQVREQSWAVHSDQEELTTLCLPTA